MHENAFRFALLAALAQVACGDSKPNRPVIGGTGAANDVAGGETSEFSGGDVPLGYCPIEVSRTPVDRERADVAAFLELAVGEHDVPLRWRRGFPDDAIRGFDVDTRLWVDVTAIAAEDVLCSTGGGGGYETDGLDEWTQRRYELGIDLSTADGAVVTSFAGRFFPLSNVPMPGDRLLSGGTTLPFEELDGALELGVDPALDASTTFAVDFRFNAQGVVGGLASHVRLPGPVYGDDTPHWSPVSAVFPAPPDAGCEWGTRVPLDEPLAFLGDTPRGAYMAAFSRFPAPITGMWQDPQTPAELGWTELSLNPGEPTHACADGRNMNVHATLHIETEDGVLSADLPVLVDIGVLSGPNVPVASSVMSKGGWLPRAEFEAVAGMRDLDLGLAEYGGFALYQSFHVERDQLRGDFNLAKWESYFSRVVSDTSLRWCAGDECEQYFCRITALAETDCE